MTKRLKFAHLLLRVFNWGLRPFWTIPAGSSFQGLGPKKLTNPYSSWHVSFTCVNCEIKEMLFAYKTAKTLINIFFLFDFKTRMCEHKIAWSLFHNDEFIVPSFHAIILTDLTGCQVLLVWLQPIFTHSIDSVKWFPFGLVWSEYIFITNLLHYYFYISYSFRTVLLGKTVCLSLLTWLD